MFRGFNSIETDGSPGLSGGMPGCASGSDSGSHFANGVVGESGHLAEEFPVVEQSISGNRKDPLSAGDVGEDVVLERLEKIAARFPRKTG